MGAARGAGRQVYATTGWPHVAARPPRILSGGGFA